MNIGEKKEEGQKRKKRRKGGKDTTMPCTVVVLPVAPMDTDAAPAAPVPMLTTPVLPVFTSAASRATRDACVFCFPREG